MRDQSYAVRGKLMCGPKPAANVRVKLWEEDTGESLAVEVTSNYKSIIYLLTDKRSLLRPASEVPSRKGRKQKNLFQSFKIHFQDQIRTTSSIQAIRTAMVNSGSLVERQSSLRLTPFSKCITTAMMASRYLRFLFDSKDPI